MKRWSTSLFIRKIRNKITIRSQHLLFEHVVQGIYQFHTLLVEKQNGSAILKNTDKFLTKLNTNYSITHQSPRYLLKRNGDVLIYPHKNLYVGVWSSLTDDCQKLETIHMCISWWVDKQSMYIHPMEYCLAIKSNELQTFWAT